MSKRDLGSKLKVRLGEWEAYGDQPVSLSESALDADAGLSHAGRAEDERLVLADASAGADGAGYVTEAQLEELRAALEQERDQSRRLLEAVAREQVLHAVTLHSQIQRGEPGAGEPEPVPRKLERLPVTYRPYPARSRHIYLWLSIIALFIAVGCTYLAYAPGR